MGESSSNRQESGASGGVSRRDFVTTAAAAGAGLVIVPRNVLGRGFQAPSDTVNIATIGIGGMGANNTRAMMSQNIVAVCDVDDALLDRALGRFQSALNPPPPTQTSPQRQPTQPRPEFSAAQLAANEKTPKQNDTDHLRKFVDQQLPKIKRYRDYREMFDKQKAVDAVIVATHLRREYRRG